MKWLLVQLVLLHGPDGRQIVVNPDSVTSMFKPAKMHDTVNCVVNLSDGKFISVIETCDYVKKTIEDRNRG
jgi:hypothetical protein